MNELERLQRENRHLRKRIQELEKTIVVITSLERSPIGADINRSIEISRVLEQQESALLIADLINTVSDKTKLNLEQQREKKRKECCLPKKLRLMLKFQRILKR